MVDLFQDESTQLIGVVNVQEYIIFKYQVQGKEFIGAYPSHNCPTELLLSWLTPDCGSFECEDLECVSIDNVAFLSAPSRNQARKAAYINFVDSSGRGFNRYPYRL